MAKSKYKSKIQWPNISPGLNFKFLNSTFHLSGVVWLWAVSQAITEYPNCQVKAEQTSTEILVDKSVVSQVDERKDQDLVNYHLYDF